MKRFRSHHKWQISKINFLIITLILVVLCFLLMLSYINDKIVPKLVVYAETEMQKFGRLIANKTVVQEINDTISTDDLFVINKNNDLIQTIDFNPIAVNRLLSIITSSIEKDFMAIEQGNYDTIGLDNNVLVDYNGDDLKRGIVFNIPSGIIFDNVFLSNIGPKIPVRFSLIGNIGSRIDTKITNYGINNALVETSVEVDINMRMILPFITKYTTVNASIPIIIKLINGTVPEYYFNGLSESSNVFALPIN